MSDTPTPPSETPVKNVADRVRVVIPLAIAVVVGVFVALGIEGDVQARLIRNRPDWVAAAFALAIVGLAVPLLWVTVRPLLPADTQGTRWAKVDALVPITGAVLLLAGVVIAVYQGAAGFGDRESPTVSVTTALVAPDGDEVLVDINASAPTLRSREKMLVRVSALRPVAASNIAAVCRQTGMTTDSGPTVPADAVRVLHWGETGPNAKGEAAKTVAANVQRDEFSHLCVYVGLLARPGEGRGRSSIVLVDLRAVGAAVS